jgi:hypothetical protein
LAGCMQIVTTEIKPDIKVNHAKQCQISHWGLALLSNADPLFNSRLNLEAALTFRIWPRPSHFTTDYHVSRCLSVESLPGLMTMFYLVFLNVYGLCRRQAPSLMRGRVSHSSSKYYLRIQSMPQREHDT